MPMSQNRDWILFLTVIVVLALVVTSAFMYPLNAMGLLNILLYELIVVTGALSILFLIYNRGVE